MVPIKLPSVGTEWRRRLRKVTRERSSFARVEFPQVPVAVEVQTLTSLKASFSWCLESFTPFFFIVKPVMQNQEKKKKKFSVLLTVDPPKRQSWKQGWASSCSCQDGDTDNKQWMNGIIMPQRDCVTQVNNLLQLTALSQENHAPHAKWKQRDQGNSGNQMESKQTGLSLSVLESANATGNTSSLSQCQTTIKTAWISTDPK